MHFRLFSIIHLIAIFMSLIMYLVGQTLLTLSCKCSIQIVLSLQLFSAYFG